MKVIYCGIRLWLPSRPSDRSIDRAVGLFSLLLHRLDSDRPDIQTDGRTDRKVPTTDGNKLTLESGETTKKSLFIPRDYSIGGRRRNVCKLPPSSKKKLLMLLSLEKEKDDLFSPISILKNRRDIFLSPSSLLRIGTAAV